MKIPLVWLKDYVEIKKTPEEIGESFTMLGLMLEKPAENNVLDLEHRYDRSDWLSILGCARDLAAYENLELKFPKLQTKKGKPGGGVEIRVDCGDIVRRFNTKVFRNIKVRKSPEWLKERLEAYGIPSINNVVDITNFVMVELGQPMHAQDLSKFRKPEIVIRRAKKDESVVTLEGMEVKLDPDAFVLTQNDKATVIGGVVGGIETAVDFDTTDIILDAGNYDQSNVRKTARRIKIQNETVQRYDKFLHPKLTEIAIQRATQLISDSAGGESYENYDYYPKPQPLRQMTLRLSRITTVSGMEIDITTAEKILTSLEYKILHADKEKLNVEVPYFRTDVEVEDDLVSDILRINGYDKIPTQVINSAPPKEITSEVYLFEEKIRDALKDLSLHEHITDPMVTYNKNDEKQIKLQNSHSEEKNALRTNIVDTLKQAVTTYYKHGMKERGIFEVGKVYLKEGKGDKYTDYKEVRMVSALYFSSPSSIEIMPDGSERDISIYALNRKLKKALSGFFLILGIPNVRYESGDGCAIIYQDKLELGTLTYNSFTLDIASLMKTRKSNMRVLDEFSQKTSFDISLIINLTQPAGLIVDAIKAYSVLVDDVKVLDVYMNPSIGNNKKSLTVRITFNLNDSVTTQTINRVRSEIFEKLKEEFGATVRSN